MKYLLLFVIRSYWFLVPPGERKKCLFKETCSIHVYRVTKQQGLFSGLKALQTRVKNCRPGYQVVNEGELKGILTKNEEFIPNIQLREKLF